MYKSVHPERHRKMGSTTAADCSELGVSQETIESERRGRERPPRRAVTALCGRKATARSERVVRHDGALEAPGSLCWSDLALRIGKRLNQAVAISLIESHETQHHQVPCRARPTGGPQGSRRFAAPRPVVGPGRTQPDGSSQTDAGLEGSRKGIGKASSVKASEG